MPYLSIMLFLKGFVKTMTLIDKKIKQNRKEMKRPRRCIKKYEFKK